MAQVPYNETVKITIRKKDGSGGDFEVTGFQMLLDRGAKYEKPGLVISGVVEKVTRTEKPRTKKS